MDQGPGARSPGPGRGRRSTGTKGRSATTTASAGTATACSAASRRRKDRPAAAFLRAMSAALLTPDHLLHGGIRAAQRKLRHDARRCRRSCRFSRLRQLDQESRAVERQIEKHHVAGTDPPRGRRPRHGDALSKRIREIVLVADLQRTPRLVADHDVAVAVLLIDPDPQHGAAAYSCRPGSSRSRGSRRPGFATARRFATAACPAPARRSDRKAIQSACQQKQPAQHRLVPTAEMTGAKASTCEFYGGSAPVAARRRWSR